MFPINPENDKTYGCKVDTITLCQCPLGGSIGMFLSDFKNLPFCQFVTRVCLTLNPFSWVPSLSPTILHVVLRGSSEQVRWVAARRVVAMMANIKGQIVWSKSEKVSNAMSIPSLSIITNPSIFVANTACERPALILRAFLNSLPKALWCGCKKLFFPALISCSTGCVAFGKVVLHKLDLCRVLGCFNTAGTFSLCTV